MARKADLDALLRAYAGIPKAVRAAAKPAIDKGADELIARMKHLAPEDEGQLQQGITKTTINDMAVHIEATDTTTVGGGDNALYQEYGVLHSPDGSRKTAANPFFWPTINTLKKRVYGRIDRAIGKAVKETWSKS